MANCVFIAASLDGFIAREDGSLDWLTSIGNPDGTDYGYSEFISRMQAIVMGRRTYETVSGFEEWPYSIPVYVLTTHEGFRDNPQKKLFFRESTPAELCAELAAAGYQNLYIDGGQTIRGFLAASLIDELTISRIPILLGSGIPLFGPEVPETALKHVRTQSFKSGLVQSTYRR